MFLGVCLWYVFINIYHKYSWHIFSFVRYFQTLFRIGSTRFHPHHQQVRVQIVPHPLQHLMLSVFSTSAILGCIFVSYCGFNLCFPGLSENQDVSSDRWWWKASLTVITVSALLFYLHQMLSPISFQFLSSFLIFFMFLKFSVYLCLSFF